MLLFDDNYFSSVLSAIKSAKKYIFVSQFKIDSSGVGGCGKVGEILKALVERCAGGVEVRVLLDFLLPVRGRAANNAVVARYLIGNGAKVRYLAGNRCVHSKIVIIDDTTLFLGSHNWALNSLSRNFELSFVTSQADIVSAVRDCFCALFDTGVVFSMQIKS